MYCHRSLDGYNWGENEFICYAKHPEIGNGNVAFFKWALINDEWVIVPRDWKGKD